MGDPRPDLVAYVSRSGTTATAARWMAERLDADLHAIAPDRYPLDRRGLARVVADSLRPPRVEPVGTVGRRRIVLAAPIWFFAPARMLSGWVRSHRFDGAEVFAVLTMTHACAPRALDALRDDIARAGGRCRAVHALRVRSTADLPSLLAPILPSLLAPLNTDLPSP